ncbi:MAG TPA: class I SAM-dependent methyltransferase [Bryobacteraceae bacterium]|nr:class I SAM-dependent methyltransferase [Bryobacteraceae bacterium]
MKLDYGIDAPRVVFQLGLWGLVALTIAVFRLDFHIGVFLFPHQGFYYPAAILLGETALMLDYSLRGKFRHRDKMLAMIQWRGDEQVLDIGTGRGLLLIGAAKHLTTGRATGIDIWSQKDLSGNNPEHAEAMIQANGVADRCELRNEPAQKMSFPSARFDVILSNQCLHNIPSDSERDEACAEIARVLKPGGKIVLSDFIHTKHYAEEFRKAGLEVQLQGWYPLLRIVYATKPATSK